MIELNIRDTFKNQDLLAYLVGGKSFPRICFTQILLLIVAICFQCVEDFKFGIENQIKCHKNFFDCDLLGPIFACFIVCILQPTLQRVPFFDKELWFGISIFIGMDIILPAWLFVIPRESKDCEAFIYLILVTNSFISFLAAFNISFQRHLVETEYKLIATQILTMI